MSAISLFTQKPLILGLKHFGFGLLGMGAISGVSAAAIEIKGNPSEVGPKIEIKIPQIQNAKQAHGKESVKDIANDVILPTGLIGFMGYKVTDGGMTPWNKEALITSTEVLPEKGPHVPSLAEAASALPAEGGGEAKIIANHGGAITNLTSIEAGVKIVRGNVTGGGTPLQAAPIAGLFAQGPNGPLPTISSDGRTSFEAYKRPFSGSGTKIALILGGLGLNARITERAINQLPAEVTLSFVPNTENLQAWINKARASGHEVMIEIPMEPFDYPDNDPGPHTLMANGDWGENQKKLDYILSRTTGYFAVTNYLGGRFAGSNNASIFMKTLKSKGLGFISDGSTNAFGTQAKAQGVKSITADRNIDSRPSAADIQAQLGALEAMAKQKGAAVGFGVGYSVTIDQIINYLGEAKARGIILAPASAVAG